MKRYLFATFVGFIAVAGLVVAQTAVSAQPKTTICHRTKSAKKPYIKITVTKSVLKGHIAHPGDIIPAPAGPCPRTVLTAHKGGRKLTATMTGANEVPGPGDADGMGTASFRLRKGQAQICAELKVSNILLPAIAAHIHQAPAGVAGPVVVPLPTPDAAGMSAGCVTVQRSLVEAILANPAGFYANVHTTDFPAGAIRGQLGS
jgi:hypothetical protein